MSSAFRSAWASLWPCGAEEDEAAALPPRAGGLAQGGEARCGSEQHGERARGQTLKPDASSHMAGARACVTSSQRFMASSAETYSRLYSLAVSRRIVTTWSMTSSVKHWRNACPRFIDDYNAEVDRYRRHGAKADMDDFVDYERIKWSRDLKLELQAPASTLNSTRQSFVLPCTGHSRSVTCISTDILERRRCTSSNGFSPTPRRRREPGRLPSVEIGYRSADIQRTGNRPHR